MARHVRAHASNADETDIHVRCLMFDVRFEAADFRPAARIAVNSLASLSSKDIFESDINSPSRINSSQYKLSSASSSTVPSLAANSARDRRSEEHTSELQSQLTISYAVF